MHGLLLAVRTTRATVVPVSNEVGPGAVAVVPTVTGRSIPLRGSVPMTRRAVSSIDQAPAS